MVATIVKVIEVTPGHRGHCLTHNKLNLKCWARGSNVHVPAIQLVIHPRGGGWQGWGGGWQGWGGGWWGGEGRSTLKVGPCRLQISPFHKLYTCNVIKI